MASELDIERFIGERDELKQRLEGVDRAKVRIVKWYNRVKEKDATVAREVEKATLEAVFRIFDEEMNK